VYDAIRPEQRVAIVIDPDAMDAQETACRSFPRETGAFEHPTRGDIPDRDDRLQPLEIHLRRRECDLDDQAQGPGSDPATVKCLADGVANTADGMLAARDIEGDPSGEAVVRKDRPLDLAVKVLVERDDAATLDHLAELLLGVWPERLEPPGGLLGANGVKEGGVSGYRPPELNDVDHGATA
jgi:hypothetical protein